MDRNRVQRIAWMAALLAVGIPAVAAAQFPSISAGASCTGAGGIAFTWTFYDDPTDPVADPEWAGFDVLRRSIEPCSDWTRVNDTPYPRLAQPVYQYTFQEPVPAAVTLYEYQVVFIDAARNPVPTGPLRLDPFSTTSHRVCCPEFSAPLTQGTIREDWGWALVVEPCAGSCYRGYYIDSPPEMLDALRPYAGTDTVIRFYGPGACGGVEGCGMAIDHYDFAPCLVSTPVRPSSWGSLKARYR